MQLDPTGFAALFPFFIVFNCSLQLVELGSALQKTLPAAEPGQDLRHWFKIHRPAGCDSYEALRAVTGDVVVLHCLQSESLKLRGQLVASDEAGLLTFVGSPVANQIEELQALGLGLSDFSAHDPIYEFLLMQRSMSLAFEDAKRMAGKLRERSRQLAMVFDLSPDGFVSFAADGHLISANAAACQLLEKNDEELAEMSLQPFCDMLESWLEPTHGQPSSIAHGTLVLDSGRVLTVERRDAADGSIVFYFRDVSRERELDRLKSEFLTTAAHELRTPMVSIFGYVELMLARTFPPEKQAKMLGTVHKQSKLMMGLIDELLALSKLESQHGADFVFARQSPMPAILRSTDALKLPENFSLQRSLPAELPEVLVDIDKLTMVFDNVLSNAIKYSPNGGLISVSARYDESETGRGVEVAISDQGIGMSPEQTARVFERFFRADPSQHIPGTGLGMSIVREILDLMGAKIKVESQLEVGTTVLIYLPVNSQ
ncbi:ATP-binding protein [Parachitinimonas caeni]|uniref:ATP-binding protein n=1 Tax=Parachitinimonas caeni TaxID=3031301 RepID=A0ABT7DRS7_9NEIS|nr:ATP-binding protein [Parachitinimonas caeni]MDK2122778.1 ATP-binding protein [Parachitinimonas caeni]